jgi:hypothetical protein
MFLRILYCKRRNDKEFLQQQKKYGGRHMKTQKVERYEEHTVILEEEIDFFMEDLVNDVIAPSLKGLPANKLTYLAESMGFDKWTWVGHYDPETKTIKAKFAKDLYI